MANEFQHKDPGSALTQDEYITTDGTGHIFDSQAQGDVLYASSATVLERLGKSGTTTHALTNTGSNNNPAWAQIPLGDGVSGTLPVANGGTGATSLTDKAVLISQDSGTDTVGSVAISSNGQIIIGGGSGPQAATLTAGTNITVTNGDGAITIAAAGGGSSVIIHKSSAQDMLQTNTTLQNVTDFVFEIGVNETWVVYMSLRLSIWANANANIAWVLPADCAMTMSATMGVIIPGSFIGGGETQTPGGPVTLDAVSDTGHWAIVRCVFRNSDTETANAQFQMCQQYSQSNQLTIKEDSYMMAFIQPA